VEELEAASGTIPKHPARIVEVAVVVAPIRTVEVPVPYEARKLAKLNVVVPREKFPVMDVVAVTATVLDAWKAAVRRSDEETVPALTHPVPVAFVKVRLGTVELAMYAMELDKVCTLICPALVAFVKVKLGMVELVMYAIVEEIPVVNDWSKLQVFATVRETVL
jgi:hypothetical protein